MKKAKIMLFLLGVLLLAGWSLQADEKLSADEFVKYLDANRSAIPFTNIEKTVSGDVLTLKIFCPKDAQESLLQAIEQSARLNYAFEGLADGSVVCRVDFPVPPAPKPGAAGPCPGKVAVLTERLRPQAFTEYRDFSGSVLPETTAVKSPTAGIVSELKVAVGSLVEKDQELLALNSGVSEEIKALEQEALRKKKILAARQNWKEKSEKAIQSAERDYQKTVAQLEAKKAQAAQVILAPLAGAVQSVAVVAGAETAVDALLLEIASNRFVLVHAPLTPADAGLFTLGEKISGRAVGGQEAEAEVVAVSGEKLTLRVDNSNGAVKPGDAFTVRKRIAEHEDVLVMPSTALAKDSLGDYVFVVEKDKAKKTYVSPGASVDGRTMILKGLSSMVQVAVTGFDCLSDGRKLRVTSQEQLAKEKMEAEAKLQKKQAAAAAAEEAKARKEKEKLEKEAARKAEAEARLQKKQAETAAAEEAKARKEKERLEKEAARKAEAEAKLQKKQAETAAAAEAKALKEKARLEKQAAAKAEPEAAAAGKAAEVKAKAPAEAAKGKCPKKAPVLADALKAETFLEYRYHSAAVAPDVVTVMGDSAGRVFEVKVSEGSLVDKGQELALIDTSRDGEIVKLQAEAARKLKNLTARRDAKPANPKAIQAAERDYQKTMDLLEKNISTSARAVLAPVAGTVQKLVIAPGADIAADVPLLEIATEESLLVNVPLNIVDSTSGQIPGRIIGLETEVTGRVAALSNGQLTLRLENADRRIKTGNAFTLRRLKTEHASAVVIPASALFKDSLGDYVFVAAKGRAKKTYVGAGPREADRVLILSGLAPEMQLILSGYECLEDGKKVKLATPADLVREKAVEIGVAQPVMKEERLSRLKIGAHGIYFLQMGENFKDTYVDLAGFGGEASYRFNRKMDFWLSGGLAMKKNVPYWSSEELSFQMIPLAGAVRYYLYEEGKLSAYVGAGPNVFLVTDKNPAGDIKTTAIGFNALAGIYYRFSSKFSLQLMTKFNMVKKDVVPDSELDEPLDLTGVECRLGVTFSL